MKFLYTAIVAIVFLTGTVSAEDKLLLNDQNEKVSYSIGYQIGRDFKTHSISISPEALVLGLRNAINGDDPSISKKEMGSILVDLQKRMVESASRLREEAAKNNSEEGKRFLDENRGKEGVVTLASGLQYRVIEEGNGPKPKPTSTVTVHYRGTLIDGTEFDSSYTRGTPATFRVDGVIAGWKEGLQLMNSGSKWQMFIPPDLAYGKSGAGRIGPDATLIFEVELISVN